MVPQEGVKLCPVVKPKPTMLLRASLAIAACVGSLLWIGWMLARVPQLQWCAAAAEVAFLLHYCLLLVPRFTSGSSSPEEHDPAVTKAYLLKHLQRVDDSEATLKGWFLDARPGDVRRDNVKELFAYAIWYRNLDQMEVEGLMPELEEFLLCLEQRMGYRAPDGYTSGLRSLTHLWDPLNHTYRPLFFYVVMELLALVCHAALLATGFRHHRMGDVSYYSFNIGPQKVVRAISSHLSKHSRSASAKTLAGNSGNLPAAAAAAVAAAVTTPVGTTATSSSSSTSTSKPCNMPIVFLHGVGAGLLPYLHFIFRLAALGQPMVLPHSKHVSMRLVRWMPSVDEMADATAAILAAHGIEQAAVVGHSYGTMVASRLVIKYDQLVHSMCLIDPVCFGMYMSDLVRNFLYIRHSSGFWVLDFIMRLVASELHCCAHFSRGFFWSSINLWDEHIPARTLVVLSGRDILAPTKQLYRWLREHTHAQVLYEPNLPHAGLLLNLAWQEHLVGAFVQLMRQPSVPAGATHSGPAAASSEAPTVAAQDGPVHLRKQQQQQQQWHGGAAAGADCASQHRDSQLLLQQQVAPVLLAGLQLGPTHVSSPSSPAAAADAMHASNGSTRGCLVHAAEADAAAAAARVSRRQRHSKKHLQQQQKQQQHRQEGEAVNGSSAAGGAAAASASAEKASKGCSLLCEPEATAHAALACRA